MAAASRLKNIAQQRNAQSNPSSFSAQNKFLIGLFQIAHPFVFILFPSSTTEHAHTSFTHIINVKLHCTRYTPLSVVSTLSSVILRSYSSKFLSRQVTQTNPNSNVKLQKSQPCLLCDKKKISTTGSHKQWILYGNHSKFNNTMAVPSQYTNTTTQWLYCQSGQILWALWLYVRQQEGMDISVVVWCQKNRPNTSRDSFHNCRR